jgi:hypothetical protein
MLLIDLAASNQVCTRYYATKALIALFRKSSPCRSSGNMQTAFERNLTAFGLDDCCIVPALLRSSLAIKCRRLWTLILSILA